MKIEKSQAVFIEYTLKNRDNQIIDTTDGRGPLGYVHGYNYLIPGLEKELDGKAIGDKLSVNIEADEAYGAYDNDLVYIVPKSNFEGAEGELEVGMQVQVNTNAEEGEAIALVTNIEGDDVTLDLNHPLAGEDLHFEIEIKEMRAATEQEIETGMVEA